MGTTDSRLLHLAKTLACIFLVAMIAVAQFAPATAYAMEVVSCSAKPNSKADGKVEGSAETRVKFEALLDDGGITGLSLTFPEGVAFTIDNALVRYKYGEDFMQREDLKDAAVIADGQTVLIELPSPTPDNVRIYVEVYDVFFPEDGGDMQITGTYTLADGTTKDIEGIPAIEVQPSPDAEKAADGLASEPWVQAWNSVPFLRLFLNPALIVSSFPVVLRGFLMALAIVLVAYPLAIPIGLVLSLMRMSKIRILRGFSSLYVNVVRGTPMFLQIYIAFFGLPLAGLNIPSFPLGVIVLSMNSAAYLCEIFRVGIQSIPKGQFEASRSLGMTGAQTMMFVIIPQTVRRVLPTMTNEFILLYKDTSLLAAVGVMEVVYYARTIVANTGSITPYVVAACFYLVITIPLAKLVGRLESRLAGNSVGSSEKKQKKRVLKDSEETVAPDVVEGISEDVLMRRL
ncbi:MAG: amino acid ABC transporter permease [Eggerthellaceae bacterium]|nr:amino acid ABC transporter permease [Eggerthellaceae bacterium]